jgi:predicted amidohydrolase
MRVAAIQTTAGSDRNANFAAGDRLVAEAADQGAALVVLPEWSSVAGSRRVLREAAENLEGPTLAWASATADRLGIHLVAGSFPERCEDGRIANTSCLVGPDGSLLATYRKIHLFDVSVPGAEFRESDTIAPGDRAVVAAMAATDASPTAPPVIGLSLCYDVRFPELFRVLTLAGATVLVVPAAFTAVTGPAHWELLLRARAVENGSFVIGAGQVGQLPHGMPACHGHSMVVDPWGVVVAERTEPSPGIVLADLDLADQARIRRELPVLANRRPEAYRGLHGIDQSEHR